MHTVMRSKTKKKMKLKSFTVGDNLVITENESVAILREIASRYR